MTDFQKREVPHAVLVCRRRAKAATRLHLPLMSRREPPPTSTTSGGSHNFVLSWSHRRRSDINVCLVLGRVESVQPTTLRKDGPFQHTSHSRVMKATTRCESSRDMARVFSNLLQLYCQITKNKCSGFSVHGIKNSGLPYFLAGAL